MSLDNALSGEFSAELRNFHLQFRLIHSTENGMVGVKRLVVEPLFGQVMAVLRIGQDSSGKLERSSRRVALATDTHHLFDQPDQSWPGRRAAFQRIVQERVQVRCGNGKMKYVG